MVKGELQQWGRQKQQQQLKTKSEIEKKTRKVVEITVITLMKKHGLFKSIKF